MALERPDDVVEHAFAYDARYAGLGDALDGDPVAPAPDRGAEPTDPLVDERADESTEHVREEDQMAVDTHDEARQVTVRRPAVPQGPLAPYRFAITLLFAAGVGTGPLSAAFEEGAGVEGALIRTLGAGVLMWVATGLVNTIFVRSSVERARAELDA